MKKKGFIIVSIIGVVLLVAGILLILLAPKKTNKEYFTDALQKSLGLKVDGDSTNAEIENTVEEFVKLIENNIYKVTINGQIIEDEAGFAKGDAIIYFGKNQFYLKAGANQNDLAINLEGMLKDNKLFFNVKDVLNNVYYIDKIDELLKTNDLNGGNEIINKIINYLGESFMDSIDNEEVNVENSELTINKKTYKTKQYSYVFSGKTLYDFVVKFIDKIKNDDTIFNEFIKLIKDNGELFNIPSGFELTKEQYKEMLDQLLQYADSLKQIGKLATVTVHMYDDEPISRQISINMQTEQGNASIKIADYKVDGYYKAAVSSMGMELYVLEISEQNANRSSVLMSMMGEEIITGYISKDNGNFELKLETVGNLSGNSMLLKINNDGTGSLNVKTEYTEANIDYEVEKVDKIPEMDVKDALPYDKMTEEDKETIEKFLRRFDAFGLNKKEAVLDSHQTNCVTLQDGSIKCLDM